MSLLRDEYGCIKDSKQTGVYAADRCPARVYMQYIDIMVEGLLERRK
jgi:hypothetical protein